MTRMPAIGPVLAPERVARDLRWACLAELRAPKPGNVSTRAPGHGMSASDFIVSARAAAPALALPASGVGERVLRAVQATRAVVGCNTNLGIVLLCAPLAHAALTPGAGHALARRLGQVLAALDQRDAVLAYRAIRLASPGGLGRVRAHDVRAEPQVTLRGAMLAAASRDRVAYQYARGYPDVFGLGLPHLRQALACFAERRWALVSLYLAFLARIPDSHIARRHGPEQAQEVLRRAAPLAATLATDGVTARLVHALRALDAELKQRGINPGTTADLTVATLFAWRLEPALAAGQRRRAALSESQSQGARVSAHR